MAPQRHGLKGRWRATFEGSLWLVVGARWLDQIEGDCSAACCGVLACCSVLCTLIYQLSICSRSAPSALLSLPLSVPSTPLRASWVLKFR